MCKAKQNKRFVQCLFSLLIFLSQSTFLYSQITVSQSEFLEIFTPGSPLYIIEGESGLINIGNYHGPSIYDFTYVDMQNLLTMNNYEVSQIPILAARYPSNASTIGEGPQNIIESPVFLSSTDSTYIIGEATIESEYRFVHYVPYELFTGFPMSYGAQFWQNIDVCDTTYDSNWQVLSTYHYNDIVAVAIDGYGTLQLPGINLECLRMRREYSWYQYKEFLFVTREGVLLVVTNVPISEPDTGYVNADYQVLLSSNFVSVDGEADISLEFSLSQNYPNPFNPSTNLKFRIVDFGMVNLKIYDISGREVRTLVNERKQPGSYAVLWDGRSDAGLQLSSGVYFYKLQASNIVQTRKMLLVR